MATTSCGRNDGSTLDAASFSEDERYLIDAYVDITFARSYYPRKPAVAESLFTVLDSTIDSDRIANTIRTVNETPERWAAIFEEIEREARERSDRIKEAESLKPKTGQKPSKKARG